MFKKAILLLLLLYSYTGYSQKFSDYFKAPKDSAIAFPIFGTCSLGATGNNYIVVEFWVHDANCTEIYHNVQNMPSADVFADFISKMVDKGYTELTMKHGIALGKKR